MLKEVVKTFPLKSTITKKKTALSLLLRSIVLDVQVNSIIQ